MRQHVYTYRYMSENIAEVGGEGMSAEEASDVRLLGWLESSGGLACLREQCSQHTAAGKVRGYISLPRSLIGCMHCTVQHLSSSGHGVLSPTASGSVQALATSRPSGATAVQR